MDNGSQQPINNNQPVTPQQPMVPPVMPPQPAPQPVGASSIYKKGGNKRLGVLLLILAGSILIFLFVVFQNGLLTLPPQKQPQPAAYAVLSPTLTPIPTPVVINNPSDLQNALNVVNNTDPNSMTSTLNQNSSDASQFTQ